MPYKQLKAHAPIIDEFTVLRKRDKKTGRLETYDELFKRAIVALKRKA